MGDHNHHHYHHSSRSDRKARRAEEQKREAQINALSLLFFIIGAFFYGLALAVVGLAKLIGAAFKKPHKTEKTGVKATKAEPIVPKATVKNHTVTVKTTVSKTPNNRTVSRTTTITKPKR